MTNIKCEDCGQEFKKNEKEYHICPDIWIESLGTKSIIVYARDELGIRWNKKGEIVLSGKKEGEK